MALIAIVANVNLHKAQDHAVSFSEYFYRGVSGFYAVIDFFVFYHFPLGVICWHCAPVVF